MGGKNFIFAIVTFLLVCVIGLCAGGTAKGQGQGTEEEYYLQEKQLLRETRQYLNRTGYTDSGVTLNRKVDADGRREYTFTIHHSRIDRMEEREREALRARLAEFCGEIQSGYLKNNSCYYFEFLLLAGS